MTNVVKLKRGSGSDPSASDMVVGEPVIRTDTAELFFKKDDGTVAKVSGGGGGPDFKYLALRNSANNGAASYPAADFTLVTDGTTTAVTPAAAATLLVSYAGVIQQPSTGTSTPANGFALSGSTIKFSANIAAAPDFIVYQESGGIGEPSDNTVSEAKLKVSNSPTNGYFLSAQSGNTGGLTWAAAPANDPSTGIDFNDNVKARFGTGNDLEIYHDGSHSHIREVGTGDLRARSNKILLMNPQSEEYFVGNSEGSVELYYDDSKKFETSSTGVSVTGQVVATTNFKGADSVDLVLGTGSDFRILHDGTDNVLTSDGGQSIRLVNHLTGGNETMGKFTPNGGVELYHNGVRKLNTEVAGVRIDGASGGDGILYLYSNAGNSNSNLWRIESTASGSNLYIKNGASGSWENNILASGNGSVRLYYDNSGKLETTSDGVTVTGKLFADNGFWCKDDDVYRCGDGTDLMIHHNSSNSWNYIQGSASGVNLAIQAKSGENSITCYADGKTELYFDHSKKLETTSTGTTITGALNIVTGALSDTLFNYNDGYNYITQGDDKITYFRNESNTIRSRIDASGHYRNQDNIKLVCGTGEDLQIYHDGSHSHITNSTGDLSLISTGDDIFIKAADDIYIRTQGDEKAIHCIGNGAVELYNDDSKKLETGVSGEYGSFTASNGAGGWSGMAVGSGVVFMSNGTDAGIWNDTDNGWMLKGNAGAATELQYDGSKKFETTSYGTRVYGQELIWLGSSGGSANTGASLILEDDNHHYLQFLSPNNKEVGILFGDDGDNDIAYITYSHTNDTMNFGTSAAAKLTISTNINIPSDTAKLRLGAGYDLQIYHDGSHSRIVDSGTGNLMLQSDRLVIADAGNSENQLVCQSDGAVELFYDGSKKFETTSTGATLHGNLKLTGGSGTDLEIHTDNAAGIIYKADQNGHKFQTWTNSAWTTAFHVLDDGAISLPQDSQQLRIGAGNDIQLYHISDVNYWKNQGSTVFKMVDTGGDTQIECNNNGATKLFYNGSQKFFTTSTGCEVSGYLNVTNSGLTAQIYHSGSGDTIGCVMRHGRGGLSGYAGKMIGFYGNDNTEEGSIVIGTSATAYNTSSDYRLKENEVAISDGITRLKTLKPYRFNFKKDPNVTVDGFFAHEVTAVPEAVNGAKDATNSDGSVKPQQIDQSKLVPLLTAALQEAIGKIEVLETKVAALEAS